MLKKMLLVLIVGLAITCAGITKAEASEVYVGTSPATGWDCYVLTETIRRHDNGTSYVTLKMYTQNGNASLSQYRFWYDPERDVMRFNNDEGYSGIANRYETPIEWEMLQVIRNY